LGNSRKEATIFERKEAGGGKDHDFSFFLVFPFFPFLGFHLFTGLKKEEREEENTVIVEQQAHRKLLSLSLTRGGRGRFQQGKVGDGERVVVMAASN